MIFNKDNWPTYVNPDWGKKSINPNSTPGKKFNEPKKSR